MLATPDFIKDEMVPPRPRLLIIAGSIIIKGRLLSAIWIPVAASAGSDSTISFIQPSALVITLSTPFCMISEATSNVLSIIDLSVKPNASRSNKMINVSNTLLRIIMLRTALYKNVYHTLK